MPYRWGREARLYTPSERHGSGTHLGTYYRIAGPVIARILMMEGITPRKAAEQLLNPAAALAGEGGGRLTRRV